MNPNIAFLFKLPRGLRWHSRLIPYEDDIRRWRNEGKSYNQIALLIGERGLLISGSAVHSYVRARARRGRSEYCLPPNPVEMSHAQKSHDSSTHIIHQLDASPALAKASLSSSKEFIYMPADKIITTLSDEDVAFNNPLD